jgi:hypothetical protein
LIDLRPLVRSPATFVERWASETRPGRWRCARRAVCGVRQAIPRGTGCARASSPKRRSSSRPFGDDVAVPRKTWLPFIEVRDDGFGFELSGPSEALTQLADAFSEDVVSAEVTPDDGSVIVVRLINEGPVTIRHQGLRVDIVGGRAALDQLADALRFVAAGPAGRSLPYHAHVEHYPGHPWLAAESEPVVVRLLPDPQRAA